jgi:serine/threonine protein kinase
LETWKEMPILVVEYFPHGTLADRLRRGPLSVREVSELGLHMAAALQYLHKHRLLHRDIKPSNIGLTGDDVPKLLDFGLARVIGNRLPALLGNAADSTVTDAGAVPADIYLTRSHQIVGTVAYLPPEAVRGEPPSVAFDLWSLSVTLYEALTGTNPFRRSTVYETVNEIVTREAPDVRQIRPDCPAALAELLADCLRHDSGRRPGSADVLTVALASCVTVSGR